MAWLHSTFNTLLPIIVSALMGYVVWLLQEQRKEKRKLDEVYTKRHYEDEAKRIANAEGTKAILLYMLKRLHTEYMYAGALNSNQYQEFKTIYKAYSGLNGNGRGTKYMADIENLPIDESISDESPYFKIMKAGEGG